MESTFAPLIAASKAGEPSATDSLFTALYVELHRVAKRQLAREGVAVSLGATTLLHQAYLEIAARDGASFPSEGQFVGYAARVMRNLIIDHARNRCALKRGGQFQFTSNPGDSEGAVDDRELIDLSTALDQLAKTEPELAQIVDMRFFCGFTFAEIAVMRNISERTAQRYWEKARIYLHNRIRSGLETDVLW